MTKSLESVPSPLYYASLEGLIESARHLLEKGADVNVQGGEYGNALYAASAEGHDRVVQLLLERGADVNAQGGRYGNALYAASAEGHDRVVELLLEKGANVNAEGGDYGNALQAASFRGRATTRSSSGCSRRGPTSTRREESMAARCKRLHIVRERLSFVQASEDTS